MARSANFLHILYLKWLKMAENSQKWLNTGKKNFMENLISSLFFGIAYFSPPPGQNMGGGALLAKIFTVVPHPEIIRNANFEFPTQVDHQKLNFVRRIEKCFMQNMRLRMEKPKISFLGVVGFSFEQDCFFLVPDLIDHITLTMPFFSF